MCQIDDLLIRLQALFRGCIRINYEEIGFESIGGYEYGSPVAGLSEQFDVGLALSVAGI